MGNWGNTLDWWYHRGAIIVWLRAQAFANCAETSPGWALDEIVSIASSGDTAAPGKPRPLWNWSGAAWAAGTRFPRSAKRYARRTPWRTRG